MTEDDADTWVQIYWIMGRSENSRNRRFVVGGTNETELRTEARDPALVSDPTNIIYDAMLELPDIYSRQQRRSHPDDPGDDRTLGTLRGCTRRARARG